MKEKHAKDYRVICNAKVNKSNKWLMSWGSWNVLDMLDFWISPGAPSSGTGNGGPTTGVPGIALEIRHETPN